MLLDFHALPEFTIPGMNQGTGTMSAKMYNDEQMRIITCKLHPGSSIGLHSHDNGDDINFIISGSGTAVCDGTEEPLTPGVCHICRQGSAHSIANTGDEDLVMWTVVVSR